MDTIDEAEAGMNEIDFRDLESVKVDACTQYECPTQITKRHIATQTLKPRPSYTKRHHETHQILETAVSQEAINSSAHLFDHNYNVPMPVPMPVALPCLPVTHPALNNNSETEIIQTVTCITEQSNTCTSEDDSDDEYICSSSEESSGDSESEMTDNCVNNTFIVYESKLNDLFKFCQQCGSPVCEISKNHTGSMVTIRTLCLQNHTCTWNSQPTTKKNVPAGNLLIPAAILFTGGTFQEFSSFAEALKLNFISKSSFYKTQDNVLFPIMNKEYKEQQLSLIDEPKNSGPANLCGDGRSDSPVHNAKYGTYSLLHEESGKIVDFSIVHVSEVSSSYAMEYEGCKRSLDNLLNDNFPVRCLTTDRHVQIAAQLRKSYPNILHQFDVWHISKSVTKKLTQKAKTKGNEDLKPWIKSISNHLWWTVQTCNEDPEVLVRNWVSIVNHVADQHTWKEGLAQVSCRHHNLTRRERKVTVWLKPGSNAHVALEEVVCNKRLLKDITKLTEFHHTGNLEVFHSLHSMRRIMRCGHAKSTSVFWVLFLLSMTSPRNQHHDDEFQRPRTIYWQSLKLSTDVFAWKSAIFISSSFLRLGWMTSTICIANNSVSLAGLGVFLYQSWISALCMGVIVTDQHKGTPQPAFQRRFRIRRHRCPSVYYSNTTATFHALLEGDLHCNFQSAVSDPKMGPKR